MPDVPDEPALTPVADPRAETIAALIRSGLANTAISQDPQSWLALETRLHEIVAAIIKEA